jgi:hypothetical protein
MKINLLVLDDECGFRTEPQSQQYETRPNGQFYHPDDY